MRTDNLIRLEGMKALSDKLGLVEAERFIALVIREQFDYTEWQRDMFEDMPLDTLIENADKLWRDTHK